MSIIVRPINAHLTHDTQLFSRMDPYVKIYFGGKLYRTAVCQDGGKNPSWNESFTLNANTDSNLRIQVWDLDATTDDLVGAGTFNLMKVYNMNGMRSDNQYVDLFHNGRSAGRILISCQLQGMNGYWGGQNNGIGQPMMNNGGWNQPQVYQQPMNNGGWQQQPPMNGGWGQPPMGNNGWGQQPPNNGWGQQPPMNNGWNNNMPPPNNGWGF